MRRYCDCYDWRYDPCARQLVAGVIYSALVMEQEQLIFRKTEWVEDCGFICGERLVDNPRRIDGKNAKIRCFTECLSLLKDGWENEIAERNREMMEEYLK